MHTVGLWTTRFFELYPPWWVVERDSLLILLTIIDKLNHNSLTVFFLFLVIKYAILIYLMTILVIKYATWAVIYTDFHVRDG